MKTKSRSTVTHPKTTVGPDVGFRVPHGTPTFGFFPYAIHNFHASDFAILFLFQTHD